MIVYLKIKKKKLEIKELNSFKEKIKSLRFVLKTIDYGVRLKKKKWVNTYWFCQRVDIIATNKENKILAIYNDIRSEKIFFPKRKTYYIYYLPVNSSNDFKVGEKLPIVIKKDS
jgi:hypothetical protein